jgi:membrane protein
MPGRGAEPARDAHAERDGAPSVVEGGRRAVRRLHLLWRHAYDTNVTGLSGMVAFNSLLSIFPFALLVLFVVGKLAQSESVEASIVRELQRLFPHAAGGTLHRTLATLRGQSTSIGIFAAVASVWVGASFWGAMDTAFCRIYERPCRSWVHQKLFAMAMLVVSALLLAAAVALPTLQGALLVGAHEVLPFGLAELHTVSLLIGIGVGTVVLFVVMSTIYATVPHGPLPWAAIWPGALLATVGVAVANWAFPLYLTNISTIARFGATFALVLIVLVWFYAVALILLIGAVLNGSRLDR